MRQSFREYIIAILKGWWAMIVFGIGDILGIITTVTGKSIFLQAWAWFTIGTVALLVAQFLAFDHVRKQRDNLSKDVTATIRQLSEDEIRKLLELKGKLQGGVDWYGAPEPILEELSIHGLIELISYRTASGPRMYDQRCWKSTSLGKKVIQYLEYEKPRVFHKGGSQT